MAVAKKKKRKVGSGAPGRAKSKAHRAALSASHLKRWKLIRAGKKAGSKRKKKTVGKTTSTTKKRRNPGRPKGSKNKTTKTTKSAVPSKMAVKVTRAKRVSTTKRGPGKTKRRPK